MSLPIEKDGIIYDLLTESEISEAVELNTLFFAKTEVTNKELNIQEDKYRNYAEHITRKSLTDGIFITAKDIENSKLVGFMVSEDHDNNLVTGIGHDPEIFKIIAPELEFLELLEKEFKRRFKFKEKECIRLMQGGVLTNHQRLGIGLVLTQQSVEIAGSMGFRYAVADCTCEASARMLEKCGFEVFNSIPYKSFSYENKNIYENLEGNRYLMFRII